MTNTPDLSRAALEALAERNAERAKDKRGEADWLREYGDFTRAPHRIADAELLEANAATLRALASRAEPPADVAGLVAEALGQAMYMRAFPTATVHHTAAPALFDRLAAALTAQAEQLAGSVIVNERLDRELLAALARAEKAEALLREAGLGQQEPHHRPHEDRP